MTAKSPVITVVVPTRNRTTFLDAALDPDSFVADQHASRRQKILHIAQAHRKAVVAQTAKEITGRGKR